MTEIFFSLSNEAIPVDNEKNTSGTTINLSEDIKIDPTISKIPLSALKDLGYAAKILATSETLDAHAFSASLRISEKNG